MLRNIIYTAKQLVVSLIVNYPIAILAILFFFALLPGIVSLLN